MMGTFTMLSKTPLHSWHAAHGGRLVDFAGWSMPVQYRSIVEEHQATRDSVGLFDVSHMGRLLFSGAGAGGFLNRILTRQVADLALGRIRYSLVTNDSGGILDDVLIYHLPNGFLAPIAASELAGAASIYHLVVNASNREKIIAWLHSQAMPRDCAMLDLTFDTAMIAVQGPGALSLIHNVLGFDASPLKYYTAAAFSWQGCHCLASRTGYTGEDGCELVCAAAAAEEFWTALVSGDHTNRATPAGLGARDTLRLEAAMPLYGHELSETVDPYQAGLSFAVDLAGRQFPGRDTLARLAQQENLPIRVGIELAGQRPARELSEIYHHDQKVGVVTSGTFSPTLRRPIAMGYAPRSLSALGTELWIDIRGRKEPARVVALPFYRRSKKG